MITGEAREKAVKVLEKCVKPVGFFASGLPGGYEAVWARDSMITSLGAPFAGKQFKQPFLRSILTLAKHQSKRGQIPNAVGSWNDERRSNITFNSIDSTLWYLIGHRVYATAYRDKHLLTKHQRSIENAFTWLSYQDPNEDGLLVQLPTMDWQDAFPHKYGRALSTQALFYLALRLYGKRAASERIRRIVNGDVERYLSLYDADMGYYLPWVWKTHGPDVREQETWFDTLGNLLAIVSGLATPTITKSILDYIEQVQVHEPYPCKTMNPSIKEGDREWHAYFAESEAGTPYSYLNGGVWPFIGGFYVAALVKAKQFSKAAEALEELAEANRKGSDREWGFHEWLNGLTGMPAGGSNPYQGWSAGMYLFAYECVARKRIPYMKA